MSFVIKTEEHVVFRKQEWRWIAVVTISLYFILCVATFYLAHEVQDQELQLSDWHVAYCQEYTKLFAAQHPEETAYLQEDLAACGTRTTTN